MKGGGAATLISIGGTCPTLSFITPAGALALSENRFGSAVKAHHNRFGVHSIVTRKLAILIARGIVTRPLGRFFLYNSETM